MGAFFWGKEKRAESPFFKFNALNSEAPISYLYDFQSGKEPIPDNLLFRQCLG